MLSEHPRYSPYALLVTTDRSLLATASAYVGEALPLAMSAAGCDRVCSSLGGSLAFDAVTGFMAVSAQWHRWVQYCRVAVRFFFKIGFLIELQK